MSEELKKGIIKGVTIGTFEISEEERKKNRKDFEALLKESGVLKDDEFIDENTGKVRKRDHKN